MVRQDMTLTCTWQVAVGQREMGRLRLNREDSGELVGNWVWGERAGGAEMMNLR